MNSTSVISEVMTTAKPWDLRSGGECWSRRNHCHG